jgi:hypothetical protein
MEMESVFAHAQDPRGVPYVENRVANRCVDWRELFVGQ